MRIDWTTTLFNESKGKWFSTILDENKPNETKHANKTENFLR